MLKSFVRSRKFSKPSTRTRHSTKDFNTTKEVAKDTKIAEGILKETFSPFVLFVCFVVMSIFVLVAAYPLQGKRREQAKMLEILVPFDPLFPTVRLYARSQIVP